MLEAIKKGFFLQVTCNEPSCYLQSFGKCETAAPKRGWSCTKIYHSCPRCHPLLQEQLWGFLEQKNRENSPMNSWDRGTTYCCPRITHTSSAQMRWAVRRPTQSLSFAFSPRAEPAPCMVWGLSRGSSVLLQLCPQTHPGCVQGHLCALCVLRDITKELPSVAMAEGWPQHGTKDHIQPQLLPFGDELRAVSLEAKAQKMSGVSVGQQWQMRADTGKGGRKSCWIQQKKLFKIKSELCFERVKGVCSSIFRFPVRIPYAAQT